MIKNMSGRFAYIKYIHLLLNVLSLRCLTEAINQNDFE